MAEAALVEEMQVPNGGIADFVMSDADIDAVYGPDDDGAEEYGTEGLGQFTDVANQMAAKGRYGDDLVAHVESGELVIPKDFLDRDPELKRSLFKYLEDHGIEDPERYVVGSKANSINPDTGMPEFFFKKIKKAVKKVAKKVSKVAKPVVKIIQKMAPVVLPIALSMTPLGPVFGAALGGGIASLINGGSIKDAFKQALISGAVGAVGVGFKGAMTPGGSFMGSIGDAVSNPMGRIGQTLTGAQNSLSSLVGGAADGPGFFSKYVNPIESVVNPSSATQQAIQSAGAPTTTTGVRLDAAAGASVPTTASAQTLDPAFSSDFASSAYNFETPYVGMPPGGSTVGAGSKLAADNAMAAFSEPYAASDFTAQQLSNATNIGQSAQPGFLDTAQDYARDTFDFFKGESSLTPAQSADISAQGSKDFLDAYNTKFGTPYTLETAPPALQKNLLAAGQTAVAQAQPGFLDKYGPMAALGAGTLALTEATGVTGFTKTPETATPGLIPQKTGSDIVKENPYLYRTHDLGYQRLNPETGEYETVQNPYPDLGSYVVPTQYTYDLAPPTRPSGGPFRRPQPSLGDFPVGRPIEDPGFRPYPYDTVYNPNMVYQAAADGGPIFPRRNGGIMPDEGVPGKDSVRAMLMPGEFVMTTDAVRGAGGGNLNRGINNMYTVMRNLESRGRRIA